jgi:hypothetical protein
VEPGDVAGLQRAIHAIAKNPGELWAKRRNAFAAGHQHYDTGIVAETWMQLFAELKNPVTASAENLRRDPTHAV